MRIKTSLINSASLIMLLCWVLLPIVSHHLGSIGFVVFFGVWLLTARFHVFVGAMRKGAPFIIWYAILLLLYFMGIFHYGNVDSLYFFTMSAFSVIPFFIGNYYICLGDTDNYEWITKLILFLSIITFISTIRVSLIYPDAPKTLAMGTSMDKYKEIYVKMNCGGYGFIYGFVISFIPVLSCTFKQRLWNSIKAIYIALGMVALIVSQYVIGIVVLALSLAIYVLSTKNKGTSIVIIKLAFIMVALIGVLYLSNIVGFFAGLFHNYATLSARLSEIATFIQYGNIGNNINSRLIVYSISWEGFLKHPLFGGAIFGLKTIGAHSTILDLLSLLGVFGMLLYFWFLFRNAKKVNNKFYTISLISFFLISLLNPTVYVVTIGFSYYMSALLFVQNGGTYESC